MITATEETTHRRRGLLARGVVGGALMGLANLVPGISGGTMLLAAGIYPQFINGVAEVSTFRFRPRTLIVLASIVGAALVAILALAGPVSALVVNHRWAMYSLFIGLTLGGVPILWEMIRPLSAGAALAAVLGIAAMAVMALVGPGGGGATADGSHPYVLYFLAGLAGACAMVLPGVSGGYLLLILGQYVAILTAVATLKNGLQGRDWALIATSLHTVIPVGIGVFVGVVGVSNLIKILLERFPRPTLGVLLGLLLGAVIGLWPFQEGVAPEVGTMFRGDRVGLSEGVLVMETTGREIEPGDYETAFFRPSGLHLAGALGLIVAGFAASSVVSHLGRDRKPRG